MNFELQTINQTTDNQYLKFITIIFLNILRLNDYKNLTNF